MQSLHEEVVKISKSALVQDDKIAVVKNQIASLQITSGMTNAQFQMMNALDFAHRRIQFYGFPTSMTASQRITEMEKYHKRTSHS